MSTPWIILFGLAAALGNVLGGFVIVKATWSRGYLRYILALGAGFMLATAILEMIPASFDLAGRLAAALLLGGFLLMHFVEHSIQAHFHFGEEVHPQEMAPHAGYTILSGLAAHAFFDGIAIAAGFLVSAWLGFAVFLAVFLHKIPEGFTIASVMLASGRGVRVAAGSASLLAAFTVAGVLSLIVLQSALKFAMPVSAGVTIYVAACDLIPEVNKEPGIGMAFVVFAGVGLFLLLEALFHAL